MAKPFVIAEIGCNHTGSMRIAKEMITTAAVYCRADSVKFQKRTVREMLTPEQYRAPHPTPHNAYGSTYGEHREFLEFSLDQHRELKQLCDQLGIVYSTSVWDVTAARDIISLNPAFIKVPSACNLNRPLLEVLAREYSGEIHLSLGMTTTDEEEKILAFFESGKRNGDLVLYACTSGYPVSFEDVALLEIERLNRAYGKRVKGIGFSGHHLGIAVDVAAYCLGSAYIERHFTLDRTWKGTDHAASLEPDGLRRLTRDLSAVSMALSHKQVSILPVEQIQRAKLKQHQIAWHG